MTTKTDEQERRDFEAWAKDRYVLQRSAYNDTYISVPTMRAWDVWQARAALQEQPMPPEISRDLLGGIVDQVFGGAIEDTAVIEDIYRVIACEFALQSQDAEDAVATAMTLVADRYAHVMAMHLECILLNYDGPFSSDAMNTLSEYRDAMDRIHEAESPTHMGEPLIDHARRIEGDGE